MFESVEKQAFRNFEWIIVDDCSTDNTNTLVEDFISKLPDIQVKFIKHKRNTGVSTSRKEALDLAKGRYFVTWDHDDIQTSDQLEIYAGLWIKYAGDDIANIFAKLTEQHGKRLGSVYPKDPFKSDYINTHNEYLVGNKVQGNVVEHHVCVKTKLFKMILQYLEEHPELLRNHKPNGGDIWGMLAHLGYQTLYTNQVVRTYFINEAGRKTMTDAPRNKGAERVYLYKLLWVNHWQKKIKSTSLNRTLRNALAVGMYGFLNQLSLSQILKDIKSNKDNHLVLCLAFPAYLLSKRYQN